MHGDLDGDGTVNIGDLLEILSQWGTCTGGCSADTNDDGRVDMADLLTVIARNGVRADHGGRPPSRHGRGYAGGPPGLRARRTLSYDPRMQPGDESPDVLICGAEPVGLALATQLVRHDIPFRIIERSDTRTTLSKALGLFAPNMEVLHNGVDVTAFLETGTVMTGANSTPRDDHCVAHPHRRRQPSVPA